MCDVFAWTQSCVCNARSWHNTPLAYRGLGPRIETTPATPLLSFQLLTNLPVRRAPPWICIPHMFSTFAIYFFLCGSISGLLSGHVMFCDLRVCGCSTVKSVLIMKIHSASEQLQAIIPAATFPL